MTTDDSTSTDETAACPTCGPTRAEQHPCHADVTRCANCKEWLTVPTLSAGDLGEAVGLWLCENYEDDEGMGCEPEAGPPCIGHMMEAAMRLEVTIDLSIPPGSGRS